MPKKFAPEFKRDVVTVARRGDLTVAEVAADFDISVESVRRWMRQADIDDGVRDGVTTAEQPELVQLRGEKRRLEMENDVGHRRPVVEDLQHRLIALLHQVQLHQHDSGLLRICGRERPQRRRWPPPWRGPSSVSQLPGSVSPRNRGRVPELSGSSRGHGVHYEPGPHNLRAYICLHSGAVAQRQRPFPASRKGPLNWSVVSGGGRI
jgi:transposase